MIHRKYEDSEQKKAKDRCQRSTIHISLLGMHNRVPQTGWLAQQKCASHIFGD